MLLRRPPPGTPRFAPVALLAALCLGPAAAAVAEETDEAALVRDLGRVARLDLALVEREQAAQRALAVPDGGPAESWQRAGLSLLRASPETGAFLLRRAVDAGLDEEAQSALRRLVEQGQPGADAPLADRARAAALAFLLGARENAAELLAPWPPGAFVKAVLQDEFGIGHGAASSPAVQTVLAAQATSEAPLLAALDRACATDPAESAAGLDALRAGGEPALALLVREARRLAQGPPPGRLLRGIQAVTALGTMGSRRATPALLACLESPHGWARAAAASALADLGDPAAAVLLARQLAYAGDPFRARESWDYPGTTETPVPPEEWAGVEYYAIDAAAADALLAMGMRGAAGWLIRNALDPTRRNLRVRVPQDALDALRRHVSGAPLPEALVDGGLPQRWEAFERLEAWWRAHRDDEDLLRLHPAEDDPGFAEAARALAARLGQPKVLELMIAKDSCELLGSALTPALAAALAAARSKVHKVELAAALARVRDPRAAAPLLALLGDPTGFVRAAAALGLGPYAAREPGVVDALLGRLDDEDCGTRVAALKSLSAAPRDPRVLAALATHDEAAHAVRCGADSDYGWAAAVVRLAQTGSAAWPAVQAGLASTDRVVRRTVWDLVRTALDLPDHAFDPVPAPGAAGARPLDTARLEAALAARGLE